MITLTAATPAARVTPPDLNGPGYRKIERVPIFATHRRVHRDPETGREWTTEVDAAQLRVVYENTLARTAAGEPPLVFVGHTRRGEPETAQPPTAGYADNIQFGEFRGEPVVLADIYIKNQVDLHELGVRDAGYVLDQFPRRSSEVFRKTEPTGYIDAVALIKRSPELDLGYVTHAKVEDYETFACPEEFCCGDDDMPKGGDGDLEREAAVKSLASALIVEIAGSDELHDVLAGKIANSDGLHTGIANKIIPMVIEQVKAALEAQADTNDDGKVDASDDTETPGEPESHEADGGGPVAPDEPAPEPPAEKPEEKSEKTPVDTENFMADENLIVELGVLKVALEKSNTENAELKSRLDAMEAFQKAETEKNRVKIRSAALERVAGLGVEIDPAASLEKFSKLSDEDFDDRVREMELYWKRSPVGTRPVQLADLPATGKVFRDGTPAGEMSEEEALGGAVEMFMKDNADKLPQKRGESASSYGVRVIEQYQSLPDAERNKYRTRARARAATITPQS